MRCSKPTLTKLRLSIVSCSYERSFWRRQILDPVHPEDWSSEGEVDLRTFALASRTNPPLLVANFTTAAELMLRDRVCPASLTLTRNQIWHQEHERPIHVLVGDADLVGRLRTTCGLTHVTDPKSELRSFPFTPAFACPHGPFCEGTSA